MLQNAVNKYFTVFNDSQVVVCKCEVFYGSMGEIERQGFKIFGVVSFEFAIFAIVYVVVHDFKFVVGENGELFNKGTKYIKDVN